ncbi:MAG: glycosyltransferase family 2 protein [Candidatus Aminicenantes bacterium]|nr:glycosyltransferase family 2 protein [Candidatus Aminicenantes bacterium]
MKVSILIPTLNEIHTIAELLDQVDRVDFGYQKEIIIIDGNSSDGTQDIIKTFAAKRDYVTFIPEKKPEGKGKAVRKGIDRSTGDIVIIQDGDLEVSPFELPKLIEPIVKGENEVVYGSRFLDGRGQTPWISYLGNKFVTQLMNILFFTRLTDIVTCHKVIKRSVLNGIVLKARSFDFDSEITALILKKKIPIKELPIKYIPRTVAEGKKLHWSVGFKVALSIFKSRFSRRLSPTPRD